MYLNKKKTPPSIIAIDMKRFSLSKRRLLPGQPTVYERTSGGFDEPSTHDR